MGMAFWPVKNSKRKDQRWQQQNSEILILCIGVACSHIAFFFKLFFHGHLIKDYNIIYGNTCVIKLEIFSTDSISQLKDSCYKSKAAVTNTFDGTFANCAQLCVTSVKMPLNVSQTLPTSILYLNTSLPTR